MALKHAMGLLVALGSLHGLFLELKLVPVAMARPHPQRVVCNMLPTDDCAFAVDSTGLRCVLETDSRSLNWHVCQTSDIRVTEGNPVEYIETEQCLKACGLAKMTVGLSTDSLMSQDFTSKLCSSDCQENCANLVDLYSNLASGEGNSMRMMCAHHQHRRRMDTEESRPMFEGSFRITIQPVYIQNFAEVVQPINTDAIAGGRSSLVAAEEPAPSSGA